MERMKLSDAIRQGAKLRPQGYRAFFPLRSTPHGNVLCSCSLGAAIEAWYGSPNDTGIVEKLDRWPELEDKHTYPGVPAYVESLQDVITYLNDVLLWTRESIAEYVATLGY